MLLYLPSSQLRCCSKLYSHVRGSPALRSIARNAPRDGNRTKANSSGHVQASYDESLGNGSLKVVARPKKKAAPVQIAQDDVKLALLRQEMLQANLGKGIDAYIIPSEDAHQSEYSADCFSRRSFVSGFTGSAGTAVVTAKKAALWTDGRYFLQAQQQLGKEWELMRSGQPGVPELADWLASELPSGACVGIDPFLFSSTTASALSSTLAAASIALLPLPDPNLVDVVWGEARPPMPSAPLRVHPLRWAGQSVPDKLAAIRSHMRQAGASALLLSALDEVAWTFNLRGSDVPHCPVFLGYSVITETQAWLLLHASKLGSEVRLHLEEAGVSVGAYEGVLDMVHSCAEKGHTMWMDPAKVNSAIVSAFQAQMEAHCEAGPAPSLLLQPSPVTLAKALKNEAELEGMRQAHLQDAAALCAFWSWLEAAVAQGEEPSEVEVAHRLLEFRSQGEGFVGTSFDTIAGCGPNGAVIHYRAEEDSCRQLSASSMFLLDSGGQYEQGTTDITRTVHFGQPSAHQKDCFTRVLKGHIGLDSCVFPSGTPGFVLDVLARGALWQAGLDYRHGTGHGVGAALNVHEGPQGVSPRYGNSTALAAGMVISNEPGYYEDGAFGIRIENLLTVREAATQFNFGGVQFLSFERLTMCPIQAKLLDLPFLTDLELDWLTAYHQEVWSKVSPLVSGRAKEWLWENTRPVQR